ncbi:unnamed protein product [Brassica rapa]|uniref:Myb/SANT-like domain-containing protein n=1 Tax=Brassica campestris TaxID=3711 RepID=A0A8D9D6B7_BRACM|nr:unnamed protein product [Brassica rapa]
METGEPSLPKKARAGYLQWTSQESQLLMRLLVDGIRRGWRDSNGSMTKTTVEAKILPVLNKQLRCNKSYKHYTNRMKSLRKEYNGYAELLRCSSGFGWDPITKRFTAPDEVWKEYFKKLLLMNSFKFNYIPGSNTKVPISKSPQISHQSKLI